MKMFSLLVCIGCAVIQAGCGIKLSHSSAERSAAEDSVVPVQLTDENFEREVLKSDEPVLVDMWAQWCQPCIELKPTLRKLAADFAGEVKVGELDVDANAFIAEKYGIDRYPTLIIFRDGQEVESLVGLQTRDELSELVRHVTGASDPVRSSLAL